MPEAYAIGHITVIDEQKWAEYRDRLPATLAPWGAELVCRGKLVRVLSGSHTNQDTVVLRFPDLDSLNNWFDSAEYQALIPLRQAAAKVDLMAFET